MPCARGTIADAGGIGEIVVRANPDGSFVRVKDIARIDLARNYNLRGRLTDSRAFALYQCGTNAVRPRISAKLMKEAKHVSCRYRLCHSARSNALVQKASAKF